jgi:hypothetical protein
MKKPLRRGLILAAAGVASLGVIWGSKTVAQIGFSVTVLLMLFEFWLLWRED